MIGLVKVPIACSLDAEAVGDRLEEWRAAFALVDEVRVTEQVARLRLTGDDEALLRVVDLAEREKQCCPFFAFSIDLDGERRWLRIAVPEEAAGVLTGFIASLTGD
jgi:hypothetical protein